MSEIPADASKTVGELQLMEAIVVSPQTSILDACKLMTEKNVDSVLIVDKSGAGVKPEYLRRPDIVGIVSVKDVVNRVVAKGLDPSKLPVSKVMTHPVHTIAPSTSLYKVAVLVNQKGFRQVPVVDSEKINGIATSNLVNTSIIRDIIEKMKRMATIFT
jgi:CBS domain-containing protein